MNENTKAWLLATATFFLGFVVAFSIFRFDTKLPYTPEPEFTSEQFKQFQADEWARQFIMWDSLWRADTAFYPFFKQDNGFRWFLKRQLERRGK
jgi:hypothetical protein